MSLQPILLNARLNSTPGVLDNALGNLLASFDAGSLVPVPRGVQPDAVTAPLITEAGSDHYLRRLAASNIAVCLGGRSGLVAIKFADQCHLDEFLARNVSCQETLITGHADGAIVWIRAVTAYQASLDLTHLQVQMKGNLLVFDRDAFQSRDEFLNIADIKGIDLCALDWGPDPDGQVVAWLVTLTHGEFVRRTQRGRIIPRRDAWRDYIVRRLKPAMAFDRATGGFWRRLAGETWQPLTEEQLISEVRQQVVSAPVPGTQAHSWCNDEWITGMLRYLRRVLVGELPFAVHSMRAFARGALILSPGRDVIVPELYAAFTRYSRECSLPVMPPLVFQKMIAAVMKESPWHKRKSKSIRRDSKCQNGFRGLTLRSSFALLKP